MAIHHLAPAGAFSIPANSKEYATVSSQAEQAMLAVIQMDPTLGLYSATAFNQGLPAQEAFYSGVSDIVQGRRPVADLPQLVQDWRSKAGDTACRIPEWPRGGERIALATREPGI